MANGRELLMSNRAAAMSGGSGLPYKRQVAYLSAINGAWIKLEVDIDRTCIIKTRFRANNFINGGAVFASTWGLNLLAIYQDESIKWFPGLNLGTYDVGIWYDCDVDLTTNPITVKFNNVIQQTYSTATSKGVGVFATYTGGHLSLCDMSSFEIVGKMKLIPVVNDFGNGEEGCFYDEITGDFHRTQGAAFTWGELNQ